MNFFKIILLTIIFSIRSYSQTTIKFATLAPDGTKWVDIVRKFSKEVERTTEGRVRFKIYPGGIQGDEKDVIRKIKTGQLNASGFTGFGLGEIAKELRVLDAPFLFKNTDEVDFIYNKFTPEFEKIFEKNGFVLLGWAEIGEVYVISKEKLLSPQDFSKTKLWVWDGDIIALKTFERFGSKPIPLSISDVMTSIQTGMINTVYATPATIIPLGWHNKMNYIIDMPITYGSGAVLLSKKTFDILQEKDKKILLDLSKKYFSNLNNVSREENKKAFEILKSKLKLLKPKDMNIFDDLAKKTREDLKSFYGNELIEKIEKEITNFRNAKKNNNKN